jgi:hypothetical protein
VEGHASGDDEDALGAERRERGNEAHVRGGGELRSDSCTTGTSAAGKASMSGTNAPWSRPRAASRRQGRPAAARSAATRAASAGEPGGL